MEQIKHYVEEIKEELEGAKCYAESYVENRINGNNSLANQYKEMANDELKHAGYLHEEVMQEIAQAERIITPPADMLEKWKTAHAEYVEKAAWVKQMLTL